MEKTELENLKKKSRNMNNLLRMYMYLIENENEKIKIDKSKFYKIFNSITEDINDILMQQILNEYKEN